MSDLNLQQVTTISNLITKFVVLDKNGMSVWKRLLKILILVGCNIFGQLFHKLYHIFDEHWRFFFALWSIPVITKRNVSGKKLLNTK